MSIEALIYCLFSVNKIKPANEQDGEAMPLSFLKETIADEEIKAHWAKVKEVIEKEKVKPEVKKK